VDDLVAAVVRADAAGLDEVWIADEGVSREPMIVLAAAARETVRIRLGVGITSPLLRHPGALAASIATLDELSGGRAMLGLGVGGELSLDPFGLTVERRVGMLRDAVRTVHDVLRGTGSERYRPPVHASPPRDVPVFIGSRGEQTLRLASREADGAFFSGLPDELLDDAFAWVRSERPIDVALYQSVRFRPDAVGAPSFLCGPPDVVAPQLAMLADRHRPASIGISLVDGDPVGVMLERAIETFALL
jgi:alkanesulfonate monooxygenase SsuD/methylene tetrahydromethanopterin reductase-like flavin-dependent oxidoreductase (luciferase family)